MKTLENVQLVSLATNIPGPVAVHRLQQLGAAVAKVEPPAGDLLAVAAPEWYQELHQGIKVIQLDLKTSRGMYGLRELLSTADVLVTSMRPSALKRLGLDWTNLQVRYPKLCQIAIVGFPEPDQEQAGHDLSYQAALGLIEQDLMPRALIADIGGAQQTVSAVLGALYLRATQNVVRYQEVSLSEAARSFALPYRHGLTATTGVLGGGFPGYNLYRASDGWLALAALESHFWQRVQDGLGVDNPTSGELAHLFSLKGVEAWQKWAADLDIPLTIVNA